MKTTIVTTTIHVPTFLRKYSDHVKARGQKYVDFIVVGDVKTPGAAKDFCKTIPNCRYLDIEAQNDYLDRFYLLKKHLPWSNIARRNVGHLMAYEEGARTIIMLDDDNLATADDCIKQHSIASMEEVRLLCFSTKDGWFNIANALDEENGVRFYPRGYPPAQRWKFPAGLMEHYEKYRVGVNAGLWLSDPDVDAITRLERPLRTTNIKAGWPGTFGLEFKTWAPWNCQNTAIARELLPTYFLSPYTGRHLDIWASYVTNRCLDHTPDVIVTFGRPLADHVRSPHNLYNDLRAELPWIQETDKFVDFLRNLNLHTTDYKQMLPIIADALRRHPEATRVADVYAAGMDAWADAFTKLG